MEGDRGISNEFNDYFEEMATAKEGNAPSYSSSLKNAAARDLPNTSQQTPMLHGHNVDPKLFGGESNRRKRQELGGKSRSPFQEQKRVSQYKELLFGKTLTCTDCKDFLAISTENALAHFPSLQTSDLGDFSVIETLDTLHLKYLGNIWRMSFVYSFDRKSYGISAGWNEFVTEYNLKAGDMVDYYKSTHPALDELYYIDCDVEKETTETESTATSAEIKTIKMYGYELNYLFEKELTPMDIPMYGHAPSVLEIPTGEKHFSPLNSDGKCYMEDLKVYDAHQVMWDMLCCQIGDTYYISGTWKDFVHTHKLQGKDVIRFFKMVNNVSDDGCNLIDYVKAKEVVKNPL